MKPPDPMAKLLDQLASVRLAAVPEQKHVASQMPEQVTQEGADLGLLDVLRVQLEVEVQPATFRAHRDGGDSGDAVPTIEMTDDRRLADRSPGLGDRGRQQEARFVGEDEVGTQPRCVFFSRGHSSPTNRPIRFSSCSSARFFGFW